LSLTTIKDDSWSDATRHLHVSCVVTQLLRTSMQQHNIKRRHRIEFCCRIDRFAVTLYTGFKACACGI